MPQTDYKLTVDDSGVIKTLTVIDKKFDSLEKSGDQAMKNVGKSGLNMGNVLSGAIGGVFAGLTTAAIQFAQTAISAFGDVLKSSTQAAVQFETTEKKFISIFEGREEEAGAVMDKIGKKAASLGLDLNEALSISRAFIPDVKGTEDPLKNIEDLLVGVRALVEEDPAQGIIGARIAIDEAMSGSLRSLKQRFEFTKAEIDILKRAQGELGEVVGTIEGINKVMQRRGFDLDAIKGTFTQTLGEMQFAAGKLRIELGKPIAIKLTESMAELNAILAENSDDLELLTGAVGDLVASVIDFISTGLAEYLSTIDFAAIVDLVTALKQTLAAAELVVDVLFDIPEASDGIEQTTQSILKLRNALLIVANIAKSLKLALEGTIKAALIVSQIKRGDIAGAFEDAKGFGDIFSAENIKKSVKSSEEAFDRFGNKIIEIKDIEERRRAAQATDTAAALERGNAFLKEGDAATQAASELEKLGLSEEQLQAIQKNAANTAKKRLEIEKQSSQQRADIQRRSIQEISDIEADHQRDIVAAGRDLGRDTRDLALKQGLERTDAEKQTKRELIDIENDFQKELDRIQRQTEQRLDTAELQQDALAFVEALRQQEIAEEEAAVTRDEAEADVQSQSEQRLADLEESQAIERAALQQSNQDKLLDLQLSLEQELAAQQLAEQRSFETQAISEQRKFDNLAQSEAEKLSELTKGLDAEVAAVVQAEAAKLSAVENFATQAQAALARLAAQASAVRGPGQSPAQQAARERLARINRGEEPVGRRRGRRRLGGEARRFGGRVIRGQSYRVGEAGIEGFIPRRQFGGGVQAGQPTLVGELGEELFVPPSSGSIIPNDQLGAFVGGGGVTNNNSTELNFEPRFQLSNPAVLSPEQAAQTKAIASSVASQMFQKVLAGGI